MSSRSPDPGTPPRAELAVLVAWAVLACTVMASAAEAWLDVLRAGPLMPYALMPVAAYALVAAGGARRGLALVAVAAVPASVTVAGALAHQGRVGPAAAGLVLAQAIAVTSGWAAAHRRREAQWERRRLVALGEAAEETVRSGLAEERARITRELQAIIGRELAAIELLLGRAGDALAWWPAEATRAAAEVQRRVSVALDELRRLLRVLDGGPPSGRATLIAALDAARARGWCIDGSGKGPEPTHGSALAAARLASELLEGPPAPGASALRVRVRARGGVLRLRLDGEGDGPPSLADPAACASLHERARLHGGRVRIVRRRGRWAVRVLLPGGAGLGLWDTARTVGDVAVTGGALAVALADALLTQRPSPAATFAYLVAVLVAPLAFRRRAPVAVALLAGAGIAVGVAGGTLGPAPYSTLPAVLLGSGAIALYEPRHRRAVAATAILVLLGGVTMAQGLGAGVSVSELPFLACVAALAFVFGRDVRGNVDRAHVLRAGRQNLTAEQHRRLAGAVERERERVARDLHDVVAHGATLISLSAGAAGASAPARPDRARQALAAATTAVAQTRVELARLTAALGEHPETSGGLGELERLVADVRTAGQPVELRVDGPPLDAVPAGVAASVFRILREALTNARKHAPGARTTVAIVVDEDCVRLEVRNPVAAGAGAHGTQRGVPGMRERARLLGGELEAGAVADGAFVVRARLPLRAG